MAGDFGKRIKAFRQFSGMSQEGLAQRLGVSFTTVNRWENGHSEPNPLARKSIEQLWVEYGFVEASHNSNRELRILIVDDEPDIIQLIQRGFQNLSMPFILETATDGFEAGYKVKSFLPHIVILDVFLPGIRGDKICQRIREDKTTEDTYIIAITGYLNAALEKNLRQSGADEVFSKPFPMDKLKLLVENCYQRLFLKEMVQN